MSSTVRAALNLAEYKAILVFSISEKSLRGHINGRPVDIYAVSGGHAAAKKQKVDEQVANNPYAQAIKDLGPLPIGRYRIGIPYQKTANDRRCDLEPLAGTFMYRRNGMQIHGWGSRGSIGCIVPLFQYPPPLTDTEYREHFHPFMDRLVASGGGLLTVVESIEGSRFA